MTIGLVSYRCKDKDISFNMSQIERFKTDSLLIWPVYVTFTTDDWKQVESDEYAKQSFLAAKDVLMINPIDIEGQNHGGSSYFHDGKLVERTSYDKEQIIIVNYGENK